MRRGAWKHWALGAASLFAGCVAAGGEAWAAPDAGGIDFQPAATETAEHVQAFHTEVLVIITVITIFVTALLIWVMIRYNKRSNPTPRKFSHNTLVEILWTVIPVLILVWIAKGSFPLLYEQDVMFGGKQVDEKEVVDIKVYGNTWYWSYEYKKDTPEEVVYDSHMLMADAPADQPDLKLHPERGDLRQLSVDYPMVAPAGKYVRLSISAKDVIHAWAMPQFAIKVDAVPGRLNQLWFKTDNPGVYYGQCSELCGLDHSNMPIELRVVTPEQYETWLVEAHKSPADGRKYLDQVAPTTPQRVAAAK